MILSYFNLQPYLTSLEIPVRVLTCGIKEPRLGAILLLSVLWNRGGVVETPWEREEDMRRIYPKLFVDEI